MSRTGWNDKFIYGYLQLRNISTEGLQYRLVDAKDQVMRPQSVRVAKRILCNADPYGCCDCRWWGGLRQSLQWSFRCDQCFAAQAEAITSYVWQAEACCRVKTSLTSLPGVMLGT